MWSIVTIEGSIYCLILIMKSKVEISKIWLLKQKFLDESLLMRHKLPQIVAVGIGLHPMLVLCTLAGCTPWQILPEFCPFSYCRGVWWRFCWLFDRSRIRHQAWHHLTGALDWKIELWCRHRSTGLLCTVHYRMCLKSDRRRTWCQRGKCRRWWSRSCRRSQGPGRMGTRTCGCRRPDRGTRGSSRRCCLRMEMQHILFLVGQVLRMKNQY